ncbi:MAG TPA: hypothetical protein VMZ30_22180 [Pyrinomonadaceae bacterium]|nr:hypothetical protein [Pyrinomonadaceae bacterium]
MKRLFPLLSIGVLLLSKGFARAQAREGKFELGGLITYTFLEQIGTTDSGVGTQAGGFRSRFVYPALPFIDFDTEINFLPGNSATSGNHLQGLFGVKAGKRFSKVGIFLKARPGFLHFRRDPFGVGESSNNFFSHERAKSTELNIDLGGVIEYYTPRNLILRFDLGDSMIRYSRRTVRTAGFVPPFEVGGFTTHNWQGSFGISFLF